MAKEHQNATLICVIISIAAAIGIAIGYFFKLPLVVVFLMLPAVLYQIYRTEGVSTKLASIGMLIVLVAEAALIIGNINFDLTNLLGGAEKRVGGYRIPLGDAKTVGPLIIALLSGILMRRTGGKYTIWLAIVILISSIGLLYTLNPDIMSRLFQSGIVEEGIRRVR